MLPKLIALDLDGTLLAPDKSISPENFTAIKAYADQGGHVLLASGRMHSSMRHYARLLKLPDDALVLSYNGAMGKTVSGSLLFESPVPQDLAKEIVAFCDTEELHLNYYLNDMLYVRELDHWSDYYRSKTSSASIAVGNLSTFDGKTPTKLLIIGDPMILDYWINIKNQQYGDQLYITKTDDEYLEFMNPSVNKGAGVAIIAGKLGISQAECACFGDGFNDIPMLVWSGQSFAMSDGREAAKSAAKSVIDNSGSAGIARALYELGLPGNLR